MHQVRTHSPNSQKTQTNKLLVLLLRLKQVLARSGFRHVLSRTLTLLG